MAPDGRAAAALRGAGAIEQSIAEVARGAVGLRAGDRDWEVLGWSDRDAESGGDAGGEGGAGARPSWLVGRASELDGGMLVVGARNAENAAALRGLVPWLRPRLLGDAPSVGLGDRLGIATPGHVAALRANPGLGVVLAQQSARELGRTGRTFADVVDAATFGALASGWRDGYAADGDHLQTMEELDEALGAGVTMFTSDPKAIVPRLPADAPAAEIEALYERLPWADLEDDRSAFESRYPADCDLGDWRLALPAGALRAAAARFGPAVVLITAMYRRIAAELADRPFTFEVAVDEIDHPTTPVDHVYIATELGRLGVRWQSLAPRFVGEFEKGIDYLGDRDAFAADVRVHARVAEAFGGYKISVHSGSDKFSIYPIIAAETRGRVHLKTSGTSYLGALRVVAETEPELFRRVWAVAASAYSGARATYHVSAVADAAPDAAGLPGHRLVELLDERNSREILHVTYGAVLHGEAEASAERRDLGEAVRRAAWRHRDAYWTELTAHIGRHLEPFSRSTLHAEKERPE